jgi:hypothetical protein
VNIAYYSSLPKTLKLTPPELMRNTGYDKKQDMFILQVAVNRIDWLFKKHDESLVVETTGSDTVPLRGTWNPEGVES